MLLLILLCAISSVASAATVAYWRFEEGPLGANVDRGGNPNGTWYAGTFDSSGNGYDLSAWSDGGFAGEAYRDSVPMGQVPLTGVADNFCLQSTGDVPGMWTETGATIQTWKPLEWTVEAFVRSTSIDNWRVAVGRDGDEVGGREDPPFRLMMTNASAFRCNFTDMAGAYHELNTSNGFVEHDQWYHVAATSDGTTFRLYVDGNMLAETLLDNTTDARLNDGSTSGVDGGDWDPGNWTVFRGMWNGGHSDRWLGYIDEVRLSDTALTPDQFLNSGGVLQGPDDWAVYPEDVTTAEFTVTVAALPYGETMTDVTWYEDISGPNTLIVDDGVKYVIDTTADASTLTIYNVDGADAGDYHATATFSDASTTDSTNKGHLFINTGLVHRYSFDNNANDSVGSAHGTIIDPNAIDPRVSFADGQMLLDNYDLSANPADANLIAYVELPAGIISSMENYMTLEIWLTPHRDNDWTPIFGFGHTYNEDPFTQGFNGGQVGILGQLNRGGNSRPSFNRIMISGQERIINSDNATIAVEEPFMYTITWDGNTNTMRLYVNGVEQSSANIDMQLADIEDTMCWLGVAFWPDSVLNASFDELRIYDTALPSYYINAHYIAGPDETVVELKPKVEAPADLAVNPTLRNDDVDTAVMVAAVSDKPAGSTVTAVTWYMDPDPAVSGDETALTPGAKYGISFTDTDTTLEIYNVDAGDGAYYYAEVTISTGASDAGGPGKLTVSTGLVHRYSFVSDATDSIGTAHGTIVDPNEHISFSGGQMVMDNPNINANIANATAGLIGYVDFPDGMVSSLHDYMTIEIWLTPHRTNDWTPIFAFGRTGNDDPFTQGFNGCQTGIYAQLNQGGNDRPASKGYNGSGNIELNSGVTIAADEAIMYAVTWNGNTGTMSLYLNGELQDSTGTNMQLADIDDTMNWLGLPYWPDSVLNASIDELRIYDWALDAPWIMEHYVVGPDQATVNPCLEYPQFDVAGGGTLGDQPDCQVTMADFAVFATEWLECGRLESCN